jgi:hypothetical protein
MLMNSGDILRGPEFDAAYAMREAKIKKLNPNRDLPPRKWGHPSLRLMDQIIDEEENAAAAARPLTPSQKSLQDVNALQNKVASQMADMSAKGMVSYDMPSMKLLDETHSHEERLSRLRVVKHKLDDIWQEAGLSTEQRAKLALNVARAVRDEHGEFKEFKKWAKKMFGAIAGALENELAERDKEIAGLRSQVKDLTLRVSHLDQLQAHH